MKPSINQFLAFSLFVATLASCKKENSIVVENTKAPNDKTRAGVQISTHVGIDASAGYYKFNPMTNTYTPITGSLGNNIIRNQATGLPLPNVTGITTDHAFPNPTASLCLSRPNATSNWQVWKFPFGNPNAAQLSVTIPNSANMSLSDLEYDHLYMGGRFYCLNRVSATATNVVELNSALGIVNQQPVTIIPNVDGLSLRENANGTGLFVSGQAAFGGTGYICMLSTNLLPFPGWTTANSVYTTSTTPVPYATTVESGLFFDQANSTGNYFAVCANVAGNNWTSCSPLVFGTGSLAPTWLASNRLIDLSGY